MKLRKIITSLLLIFSILGVVSCTDETTPPNLEIKNEDITISFNLDGGTMLNDRIIVKKGSSLTNIETPVKEGYVFNGWYYDEKLENKFEYSDVLNEDTTLYASYIEDIVYIEINSIEEFKLMSATGNYKLNVDLDFKNETIDLKFNQSNPYKGIFDGGNHTIKNFKTTGTYNGLFGYVEGTIKNLKVNTSIELEVSSTVYVGLIAGYVYLGNIENCYAEGLIRVKNNHDVLSTYCGGIVGRNELGVISKSYTNVLISNTAIATSYSGAIVGYNGGGDSQEGVITTCYANEGTIYSTSTGINGSAYSGGIVGFNFGLVDKCFTTNLDIQSRTNYYTCYAAGIVADNNGGRVTNSFSSSKVLVISDTGDTFRGGIVGRNFRASRKENSGTMENCYSYEGQEVIYRAQESIKNRHHNNATAQVTLNELNDANWYKTILGFDAPYLIKNNYFPSLTTSFKKVNIAEYKPIEITTAEQLLTLDVSKNYILKNDIIVDVNSFKAIGSYDNPFYGTFDGNGKTITFTNLSATSGIYNGLFGYLNGNVKNLNVKYNISSKSSQNTAIYIAPIAGYLVKGYIENCSAVVDMNCEAPSLIVGGLVAYNEDGTIVKSYSTGNIKIKAVNKSNYLGGLVAISNFGTIDQCYSNIELDTTGTDSLVVGGLIADNNYLVSNSYAVGTIIVNLASKNYIGGFIGINKDLAIVESCFSYINYSVPQEDKELFLMGGFTGQNTANIDKCCYLTNLDLYSSGHSVVFTNVVKLDSETIKTASNLLSDKFYDAEYPHLTFEKEDK